MNWRSKIARAIGATPRDELDEKFNGMYRYLDHEFAEVHAHLDAATETLAETEPLPGELTPEQRTGLHAIRAQVGAKHNPPPTQRTELPAPRVVEDIESRCPKCGFTRADFYQPSDSIYPFVVCRSCRGHREPTVNDIRAAADVPEKPFEPLYRKEH